MINLSKARELLKSEGYIDIGKKNTIKNTLNFVVREWVNEPNGRYYTKEAHAVAKVTKIPFHIDQNYYKSMDLLKEYVYKSRELSEEEMNIVSDYFDINSIVKTDRGFEYRRTKENIFIDLTEDEFLEKVNEGMKWRIKRAYNEMVKAINAL